MNRVVATRSSVTPACDTQPMEEGPGRGHGTSCEGTTGGDAVLEWLSTSEALTLARRRLRAARLGFARDLAEDVLGDATVAVIKRMASPTPFEVDNPAAYGTRVVQNVVKGLNRGDVVHLDELNDQPALEEPAVDSELTDELRLLVEHADAAPWLTSAALGYICFTMFPDSVPPYVPAPVAGARPDQALAWPALWFAGQRDLFPEDGADPHKRRRARRIAKVRAHLADVSARCRYQVERSCG